ncbi:hypothetical protein [Aeromicrobium ginsengisoli]|uniref:hypothetical protein n=1 Tax=Aeromicrobium ginsengisoli TaxID=363867 RepID=UPI00165F8AB2|nr:hypothetical protein [Aeromicrobium ginsengisoli]
MNTFSARVSHATDVLIAAGAIQAELIDLLRDCEDDAVGRRVMDIALDAIDRLHPAG